MNKTSEIIERLERVVDVQRLIDKLSFELDDFETANLEQPKLMLEAGRYRTWAVLEKARAEYRLETTEAELALQLRARRTEKVTNPEIAAMIAVDERVRKLKKAAYLAKASDEYSRQLVEAYNQRLQVLNNITKIRAGEIASELRAVKEKAAIDSVRRSASRLQKN